MQRTGRQVSFGPSVGPCYHTPDSSSGLLPSDLNICTLPHLPLSCSQRMCMCRCAGVYGSKQKFSVESHDSGLSTEQNLWISSCRKSGARKTRGELFPNCSGKQQKRHRFEKRGGQSSETEPSGTSPPLSVGSKRVPLPGLPRDPSSPLRV